MIRREKLSEVLQHKQTGYITVQRKPYLVESSELSTETLHSQSTRYDLYYKMGCSMIVDRGDEIEVCKKKMIAQMVHFFYGDFVEDLFTLQNYVYHGERDKAIQKIGDLLREIQGGY